MKKKIVFFGRIKTIEVECPKCKIRQFEDKKNQKCCDCSFDFKKEKEEKRPIYHRMLFISAALDYAMANGMKRMKRII